MNSIHKHLHLKQLIDQNGNLPPTSFKESITQERLALKCMETFLGCTIVIRDKFFILSGPELYYGGIGDMAHDWFRATFPNKYPVRTSYNKERSKIHLLNGPRIYLNQAGNSNYKRFDIVLGPPLEWRLVF